MYSNNPYKSNRVNSAFMTDYYTWTSAEPTKSFFEECLFNNQSLYPDYISKDKVITEFEEHYKGIADHSDNLCRYLTFELWLQQVYNNRYREGIE